MSEPISPHEAHLLAPPRCHGKWWHWLMNSRFLMISLAVHLLFGLFATYLVVQNITAKRKLTFNAPPPSANPGQKATEHQVQMAKKRLSMTAPTQQSKRITTTGASKVALPDMPSMPSFGAVPSQISAPGGGAATFGKMGSPGTGGPIPFFGFKTANATSFVGAFYDLKQTKDGKPTGMTPEKYGQEVLSFLRAGWSQNILNKYFRAPDLIYATQIFTPNIDAAEGPKAFGLDSKVKPSLWLVYYRARISPPETGKYHFVGAGDDVMLVRFNGQFVLDRCWYLKTGLKTQTESPIVWSGLTFARSSTLELNLGQYYDIDILIGEQPGGRGWAELLF